MDGGNIYHSLRDLFGRQDLDYAKFVAKLAGERTLVRSYFYTARVDQSREPVNYRNQQKFLHHLSEVEYLEVRLGRIAYSDRDGGTHYEKGVDIKLATDMLVHGSKRMCDTVVLVSGDTDYVDALQAIKDMGLHAEVALFARGTSFHLREVADRVIEIDEAMLNACWIK